MRLEHTTISYYQGPKIKSSKSWRGEGDRLNEIVAIFNFDTIHSGEALTYFPEQLFR